MYSSINVSKNQSDGMVSDHYISVDSYQLFDNPLSSTRKIESYRDRDFYYCIEDAINRYKQVNRAESYDTTPANPLRSELESLSYKLSPHISFYDDAVKVTVILNKNEFIIDCDYENPGYIFVSFFKTIN
jgi:hypothetical protein